ncbi:MAG TPA: hypothetical protein VHK06_07700, partial [Candidatus Limnocylindria bacterium]|nr:hypothetical protein [Candidatus Limnocylindria bacterium]
WRHSMPDAAELAVVVLLGVVAAALVARPLLGRSAAGGPADAHAEADALDETALRHRVALEALRDVEADRRAGSLDEPAYLRLRAEAEAEAARTLTELDRRRAAAPHHAGPTRDRVARRVVAGAGLALGAAVLGGYLLPPPAGLASQTVDVRERALERAVARVEANPRDPQALSQLADALLATGDADDRARGARVLIGLIGLQPQNVDAYRRLITAYVEAGDYRNAAAATESLADVAPPGAPDVPFFRALIARAEGRTDDASRELERFLGLAPDDPRARMARRLLDELRAGGAP